MQFSNWILSTIVAISLLAPVARAQEPASAASPAQTQSKSTPAKKQTSQPAMPAKKQEAQKLNPVVVTATRIEQPIADIGTTITVVEDSQIQEQKIDRVEDALRQVPGVLVTQTGSPGSETGVSIRGATSAQTLVLVDGVEVNLGATGGFDIGNLTTDNLDRIEVLRGAGGSLYGSGDRRGSQCAVAGGAGPADSEPDLSGRQSRDQRAGRHRQRRRGKSRLLGRDVVLLD